MKRRRRLLAHPGFLALLLGLGALLFYWPFLQFARDWPQPHTAVYFFLAWGLFIFITLLVSRSLRPRDGREPRLPPRSPSRPD